MNPKLMLLDEITSALDPQLVSEVLTLVRELSERDGMTMILATHEMSFAREVAHKICFLDGGEILEEGPPEQIFSDAPRGAHAAVPGAHHRGGAALMGLCGAPPRDRKGPLAVAGHHRGAALLLLADGVVARDRPAAGHEWTHDGKPWIIFHQPRPGRGYDLLRGAVRMLDRSAARVALARRAGLGGVVLGARVATHRVRPGRHHTGAGARGLALDGWSAVACTCDALATAAHRLSTRGRGRDARRSACHALVDALVDARARRAAERPRGIEPSEHRPDRAASSPGRR